MFSNKYVTMPPGGWYRQKPSCGIIMNTDYHLDNALIGEWLFNEGAGTLVRDSLHKNNGIVMGAITPQWINNGISLNSVSGWNQYINIGKLGNFGSSIMNGITIEAWLKTPTSAMGSIIGYLDTILRNSLLIEVNTQNGGLELTNSVRVFIGDYYGNRLSGYTADIWPNNDIIHHLVVTINPATLVIIIYVDSIPHSISAYDTRSYFTTFSNYISDVWVGARNDLFVSQPKYLIGQINHLTIWNRVLNIAEIRCRYGQPYIDYSVNTISTIGLNNIVNNLTYNIGYKLNININNNFAYNQCQQIASIIISDIEIKQTICNNNILPLDISIQKVSNGVFLLGIRDTSWILDTRNNHWILDKITNEWILNNR